MKKSKKTIKAIIKEAGSRGVTMRELAKLSSDFRKLSEDEKNAEICRVIKNGKAVWSNLGKGFSGRGIDRIALVNPLMFAARHVL